MSEESTWLAHDHRAYEAALAECELAAGAGDWREAVALFSAFADDFALHMRMEDEVLYPRFAAHGDPKGDIAALSEEHARIERLLQDLGYVVKRRDFDHFLESLSPLRQAMAQHNAHEEEVFRSPAGAAVFLERDDILARLQSLERSGDL